MTITRPRALIADDEANLRLDLASKLARMWPELDLQAQASNGLEALEMLVEHRPDVAFLDIKMPGLSGLEVVRQASASEGFASRLVFVTAYDEFALQAFEREAVDYLVKPVEDSRLQRCIERLKKSLAQSDHVPRLNELLAQLGNTVAGKPKLRWLRATRGDTSTHIPVQDLLYLQSDDKYTTAHTAEGEHVLRMSIAELVEGLDSELFWQIHRSIIVNMLQVAGTRRDEASRLFVQLKNRKTELPVSRAWVHLFKP